MTHWYRSRGRARFTCPKLHLSPCIFYFPPSPDFQAQSLRWNLVHENLVFSLSANGNTHSWLRQEDIEHITPAECTHTNTHSNAILLPWGSPDFELWPVTQRKAELNLYTWSMLQLDTAGEGCNVNNLSLLTMLCRIQKAVFRARHCTYHPSSLLPLYYLLKASYWNVSKSMGSVISLPEPLRIRKDPKQIISQAQVRKMAELTYPNLFHRQEHTLK